MPRITPAVLAGLAVAAVVSLSACSAATDDTSAPASEATTATSTTASTSSATSSEGQSAGAYVTYDQYQDAADMYADSSVVLFFNAAWCPDCQKANESFSSETIPDGLVIVSVDYDTSTDLKQRYGVTQQHTFVQVDSSGEQVAKWSGSYTVADVEAEIS